MTLKLISKTIEKIAFKGGQHHPQLTEPLIKTTSSFQKSKVKCWWLKNENKSNVWKMLVSRAQRGKQSPSPILSLHPYFSVSCFLQGLQWLLRIYLLS